MMRLISYDLQIKCLFVLLLCVISLKLSAQVHDNEVISYGQTEEILRRDTLAVQRLFQNYYSEYGFLNHSFDYENKNQISILQMRSKNVLISGIVVELGLMTLNALLADKYNWSLWIDIPCATIVATAAVAPFFIWSHNLSQRASALEQQTAYLVNIGDSMDLGVTRYTDDNNICLNAVGLGLKLSF